MGMQTWEFDPAMRGGVPMPPPPPFIEPAVQRGRGTLVVLVWITAVLGAIAVVAAATVIGSVPGATLAIVYSLIPLPLVLAMYWWIDRIEPEPWRYKAAAFTWGAIVAVVLAIAVEGLFALTGVSENIQIALGAPLIEEAAKGLFVLLTLVRARRIITGVLDGVVVAGLVATGFAVVENVAYYAVSYLGFDEALPISGVEAATMTFVVRGIFSPLAHPLFTASLGVAVGLAVARSTRFGRWTIIGLGYLGSVALHALWNGSLVFTGAAGFFVVYLVLAMLLVLMLVLVVVLRLREVDTLHRSLDQVAASGWMHPAEVPHLVRFGRRRLACHHAAASGSAALVAMKRYQKLATEVGFLHADLVAGRDVPRGAERLHGLLDQMWILRPWLRFPPALPPGAR